MKKLVLAAQSPRAFAWAVALVFALKLLLAWLFPVAGDEAYFMIWAAHPALGYYDHPPMAGWLLALFALAGEHPLWLRLPSIAAGTLLPLLIYRVLQPHDERKARLVALLLMISPVYLVTIIMTTDVPLVLFGALSALMLHRALESKKNLDFLLAGVLLGLAFLSKYFAVLLGLGFFVYFLLFARERWRGFLLLFIAVIPFGLINLYYNYNQCWYNILFNLINRQASGEGGLVHLPIYLGTLVYLLTPWLLWQTWKNRTAFRAQNSRPPFLFFAVAGGVGLLIFLLLSGSKLIGLHWLLLFVLLLYPLFTALPLAALERVLVWTGWFSAAHVVLILGLLLTPVERFSASRSYGDIVFNLKPQAVAGALAQFEGADFYATDGYTPSAILSFYTPRYWSVFGTGSRYAREDDRITDWRRHDGQNMLFFQRKKVPLERLTPFFDSVEVQPLTVLGARYEVAIARGFNYEAYRQGVLEPIRDRYYRIPGALPVGGCDFLKRYFEADCPF